MNTKLIKTASVACLWLLTHLNIAHANVSEQTSNFDQQTLNAFKQLTRYKHIDYQLKFLNKWSKNKVHAGPLIKNGDNNGLVDIDTTLAEYLPVNHDVCGQPSPTIRQAVTCTVNDNFGGNGSPEKVGFSTQGKELLASQLGNPDGMKVLIITQQHGTEPAGTEAALKLLKWLSFSKQKSAQAILEKLNILMIVRANPDGGEPDLKNCAALPATGSVITHDCAMIRENLDASAGGTFTRNTEPGFNGIVGQGYDLNRYHFIDLQSPIRPVETQAMVATALAFQPAIVLDIHGDIHKTDCDLDFTSLNPGQVLGQLPTVECLNPNSSSDLRLISPFADAVFDIEKQNMVQSLAVNIMQKVDDKFEGSVGRFSQIILDDNNLAEGSVANYQLIGIASSGWETTNFDKELRPAVIAVENFQPVMSISAGLPDAKFLRKQIKINTVALFESLKSLASFTEEMPTDGNGFCDYPLTTGLVAELKPEQWGELATEGEIKVPMLEALGIPLITSGNCP